MQYPEYLKNAVNKDKYEPRADRMSVTRLIGPPLIRTLELLHWDDIEEEVESKLWALDGIGFDYVMKRFSRWGLTNIKLEVPFPSAKMTVVAKLDYYGVLDFLLADLKRTSVWSVKDALKNCKHEWVRQINVYDRLLYQEVPQLKVDRLEIHAFARDWRPLENLRYNDYPGKVEIIQAPRWSRDEQMDYIDAQLQDHIKNSERECTPEEKWMKPDQYAVYKGKNKTASRVLDTEADARQWILEKGNLKDMRIEKRPGECVRCNSYCQVAPYCKYFKKGK